MLSPIYSSYDNNVENNFQRFPAIVRRFPAIFSNCQQFPAILKNSQDFPIISKNFQQFSNDFQEFSSNLIAIFQYSLAIPSKSSAIFSNFQQFSTIFKNFQEFPGNYEIPPDLGVYSGGLTDLGVYSGSQWKRSWKSLKLMELCNKLIWHCLKML